MFYRNFFTRVQDHDDFKDYLYSSKITSRKYDIKAVRLFEDCFSNHVDYFDESIQDLTYNKESDTRYINQDILSAYFINKIYQTPTITDYKTDTTIIWNNFVSEFCENNFTKSNDRYKLGSNRIRYLLGDVGSGKTAFTKKLICEINKNKETLDEEYNIITVYINLEEKYNYGVKPKPLIPDFLQYLYGRIYEELENREVDIDFSTLSSIIPSANPVLSLKKIISAAKSSGHRIVLFIDNLDFYHYHYARYSAFEEFNDEQTISVKDNILWLLSRLSGSDALGHMGLSILISARIYIYDEIVSNSGGISTDIDTTRAITLSLSSEDVVVGSRISLLSDAIDLISENKHGSAASMREQLIALKTNMFAEHVSDRYRSFDAPIKSIYRLGQHGYRSLVHFLSSLSISYLEYELLDRFLRRQATSLYLIYFNNMYRRYTQSQNHFPNMFLVDCTVMKNKGFEKAHQPHMHTYWLKYFMLKLINSKKSITVGMLVDIFVNIGGYDDHVVRHVIGSLCTANEFRCAEIDSKEADKPLNSRKIRPTERGKMLFEKHDDIEFCFDFIYLQTIIDDKWISYPNNSFNSIYSSDVDYNYLYLNDRRYIDQTQRNVVSCCARVLNFIHILSSSYDEEIRKRKTKLNKHLHNENMLPDLDKISKNIIESTIKVIDSLGGYNVSRQDKAQLTEMMNNIKRNTSVPTSLSKYYKSKVKVES